APPPLQRREDHEEIGDAVALIFVIVTCGLAGLGGDRRARLGDQLLGGLVHTHERTIGISRPPGCDPGVSSTSSMAATKPALASGGITHCRLRCGLFFRVRPIVLSLALSTMLNSTTFSSSRRRLQRANPSGAGEQARVISFASAAPSKIRGRAELGLYLRVSVASNPSSTSC